MAFKERLATWKIVHRPSSIRKPPEAACARKDFAPPNSLHKPRMVLMSGLCPPCFHPIKPRPSPPVVSPATPVLSWRQSKKPSSRPHRAGVQPANERAARARLGKQEWRSHSCGRPVRAPPIQLGWSRLRGQA
jgi:hypothetical protein